MRVLALDLGSKRIGVAVSDLTGTVASPLTVIQRSKSQNPKSQNPKSENPKSENPKSWRHDHQRIAALVRDEEAELVVIGLPISMSGQLGPAAKAALAESAALATLIDVPIETYDERLSTVTAQRALTEAGVRGPAGRQVIDKIAAAIFLQAFLDGRKGLDHRAGTAS